MLNLPLFAAGFVCGAITIIFASYSVLHRMSNRFHAMVELAKTEHELEGRRINSESGRQHPVRHDSGAQSRITDGMGFKAGTLARWNADNGGG